jgi:hypothetical protein
MTLPLCAYRPSALDGEPAQKPAASARTNSANRFWDFINTPHGKRESDVLLVAAARQCVQ